MKKLLKRKNNLRSVVCTLFVCNFLAQQYVSFAQANKASVKPKASIIQVRKKTARKPTPPPVKKIDPIVELEKAAAKQLQQKQYAKAVTSYRRLVAQNPTKQLSYLRSALAAQLQVVKWPAKPDWNKLTSIPRNSGMALLRTLMVDLDAADGDSPNWLSAAHIGLIDYRSGRMDTAFKSWDELMARAIDREHAPRALGLMIQAATKSKRWTEVERLARVGLKSSIDPIYLKSKWKSRDFLADALFQQGEARFAAKDFSSAKTKLAEFYSAFSVDKRAERALYLLVKCNESLRDLAAALATADDHLQRYNKSRYREEVMGLAFYWSMLAAKEEKAISLGRQFANEFRSSRRFIANTENLVDLMIARELYGDAIAVLRGLVLSASLPKSSRLGWADRVLDIAYRYGSSGSALVAATELIKLNPPARMESRALIVQARVYTEKNQMDAVRKIETRLRRIAANDSEIQDYHGEVLFILAKTETSKTKKEIFNLELKDPLATLNREYSDYQKSIAFFQAVCDAGQSSYCAPAMKLASEESDKMIKRLDEVTIPQTFTKNSVDAFEARKTQILSKLADDAEKFSTSASDKLARSLTRPDWTQEILWENSNDWNFDRVTGESANGYLQFYVR